MIYQYNADLQIIAEYPTLKEVERILSIPERTVSACVLRGAFCRSKWYFSRNKDFTPPIRMKGPRPGKKFTVCVTDEIWDQMLRLIGQRNKQDVFRDLLKNWIDKENDKH